MHRALLSCGAALLAACAASTEPRPVPEALDCVRETGSRIENRLENRDQCLPVAGRSYSREDLQRTGMPTTAEAIRRTQP